MGSIAVPQTVKQWNVVSHNGFDGLKFSEQPLPELGDSQVLVKSEYYFKPSWQSSHVLVLTRTLQSRAHLSTLVNQQSNALCKTSH